MPRLALPLSPKDIGLEITGGNVTHSEAAAAPDQQLQEQKACYNHHRSHFFSGSSFRL